MKTRAVSRAKMVRAAKALVEAGLPFAGFRMRPDGSVDALVGEPASPPPLTAAANDPHAVDPLDRELAEWDRQHGHG